MGGRGCVLAVEGWLALGRGGGEGGEEGGRGGEGRWWRAPCSSQRVGGGAAPPTNISPASLPHGSPPPVQPTQARVWRGGRHVDVTVPLRVKRELVPAHSHDLRPEYFIYAGEGRSGCV